MYIVAKFNTETSKTEFSKIDIPEKNQLKRFQSIVDGNIEIPFISEKLRDVGIDVIINEEGKLIGLPITAVINDCKNKMLDVICGKIIFAGFNANNGESIPLTDDQISWIQDNIIAEEHHVMLVTPDNELITVPVIEW